MTEFAERRPLVALFTLLFLQIVLLSVQVRSDDGEVMIRSWATAAFAPVAMGLEAIADVVGGAGGWVADVWRVSSKNQALSEENQRLRYEIYRLREERRLETRLADFDRLSRSFEFKPLLASVIWNQAPFFEHRMLINAGVADGVRADAAVVAPRGIVGRIVHSIAGSSEVELITNLGAAAAAVAGPERVEGMVQGEGDGTLTMILVPNSQDVPVGAEVIATGRDRIYPKGFPIGEVILSQPGPMSQRRISIRPFVDFGRLEEVGVVISAPEAPRLD